jgi:hypothetical protein
MIAKTVRELESKLKADRSVDGVEYNDSYNQVFFTYKGVEYVAGEAAAPDPPKKFGFNKWVGDGQEEYFDSYEELMNLLRKVRGRKVAESALPLRWGTPTSVIAW